MALGIVVDSLDRKGPTVRYIVHKEVTKLADLKGTTAILGVSELEDKLLASYNKADQTVRKQAAELVFRATNQSSIDQILNKIAVYAKRSNKNDE